MPWPFQSIPAPAATNFPPVTSAQGTVAPAIQQAFKDLKAKWPNRKTVSDGTLPSPEHMKASPNSDHNTGEAFDITVDPDNGPSREELEAMALADPRTKYVISNRRIFNRQLGDKDWRPYTGSNPHDKHVHISILHEARDDTRPWSV